MMGALAEVGAPGGFIESVGRSVGRSAEERGEERSRGGVYT